MLTRSTARAFTLIELLVGLAIFAILTTFALPSYTIWLQNTKIRNAAESIQNGLQLARSEAVSRNTNVQFTLTADSGWTIRVVTTGETLQSRPAEQGSAGVTATPTPASGAVTFSSLGRAVANADGSASITRVALDVPPTVLAPGMSRPLNVTISAAGRIRMCDPNVSEPTDPRVCS